MGKLRKAKRINLWDTLVHDGLVSKQANNRENYLSLKNRFDKGLKLCRDTSLFRSFQTAIAPCATQLKRIRCIGLGTPSSENRPLYQLCLLKHLAGGLGIEDVSVWDPHLNALERRFLRQDLRYRVEQVYSSEGFVDEVLWFMPFVPFTSIEWVIEFEQPMFILANNLLSSNVELAEEILTEKYPFCRYIKRYLGGGPKMSEPTPYRCHFSKVKMAATREGIGEGTDEEGEGTDEESDGGSDGESEGGSNQSAPSAPWKDSVSDLKFMKLTN
ncbi:DEKNAAC102100 [Brettanomyces naardenensis]|uniref:DEKNAAC102100 n=1 Tax=Brettanomyces naardenensis TaxID=13370 RepID=A0A448YJJ2_BRENA|nr:DEKNAAC102100 [Brettanomyces naardenensis]